MAVLQPDLALALAAVFVAVGLLTGLGVSALVSRGAPGRKRLEALVSAGVVSSAMAADTFPGARGRAGQGTALVPKSFRSMTANQRRLATAGYRSSTASTIYSV